MSPIVVIVLVFLGAAMTLGVVAYLTYQRKLRRAKAIERGLKMVPILIHLPPPSSDTGVGSRDIREVMREKTSQAEVLYNLIAGTAMEGFKSKFYGQRHIALELIAINGIVHFFAAVPVALVGPVKKAIVTAYPGARCEEVENHNIFNQEGRLAATLGGEMTLRAESAYPIATYAKLERDPMEALLTTISALEKKDGVAIQIMLRPANPKWMKRSIQMATAMRKGRRHGMAFSLADLARAVVKSPSARRDERRAELGNGAKTELTTLEQTEVEAIEDKTKQQGFEVLVRVIVSTGSVARSQQLLRDIATVFALFEAPGSNGFKFLPAVDVQGLVTAYMFRFFPPELNSNILNSRELATLFHLPDSQFTPSAAVQRQMTKQVDGPVQLSSEGLIIGYNEFRGIKKEIRLSSEDRRRHTYILGQTGTGKSTMLENLAVQDMRAGRGFAFIDPHGDTAEKLLRLAPKERAEDIIYFDPADTQYPLGLNLFEFTDPMQKDFIVQETINMLYKLYDPGRTGIIGPRYEHWYRNAALTLMSDPNGSTFIEIPKVFTDTDYLKRKFRYLKDPTVIDFWTKEMGQTSDYHKSEMLGWFVSKFGAFQNNEMMRNILGQVHSSFNLRDVMDGKKILIVNLSKGRIGELNSQLLGMIFVIKFQAAAMSRADVTEDQRADFCLYVDEFQNFSTDSFASILSEARKYRLNLVVANQFIGQLKPEIRDAVFGNIGTIVAHRMGPEDAEFMVKQFAPVFDVGDLVNIPNFNAVMRLMIGGLPSQPFSIRDLAPVGSANAELGMAIKQLSAAKFGRVKSQVEADILDRLSSGGGVGDLGVSAPGGTVSSGQVPPPAASVGAFGAMATAGAAPMMNQGGAGMMDQGMPGGNAPGAGAVNASQGAVGGMASGTGVNGGMPGGAVPGAGGDGATGLVSAVGVAPAPAPAVAPVATVASVPAVASAPAAGVVASGMPTNATPPVMAGNAAVSVPGVARDVVPMPGAGGVSSAPVPAIVAPGVMMPAPSLSSVVDTAQTIAAGSANTGLAPSSMVAGGVGGAMGMTGAPGAAVVPPTPAVNMSPTMGSAGTVGSVDGTVDAQRDAMMSNAASGMALPVASGGAGAGLSVAMSPPPIGAPPVALPSEPLSSEPISSAVISQIPNEPVLDNMAATPPPIGAPPVDVINPSKPQVLVGAESGGATGAPITAEPSLPAPQTSRSESVSASPKTSDPGSLSLSDITGGKPLPRPTQQQDIQLGMGRPLEGDPYANIDVLGDLTPPTITDSVAIPADNGSGLAATDQTALQSAPTGQPLPGDPYADIDVLAAIPPFVPVPMTSQSGIETRPVEAAIAQSMPVSGSEGDGFVPSAQVLPVQSMMAGEVPAVSTNDAVMPVGTGAGAAFAPSTELISGPARTSGLAVGAPSGSVTEASLPTVAAQSAAFTSAGSVELPVTAPPETVPVSPAVLPVQQSGSMVQQSEALVSPVLNQPLQPSPAVATVVSRGDDASVQESQPVSQPVPELVTSSVPPAAPVEDRQSVSSLPQSEMGQVLPPSGGGLVMVPSDDGGRSQDTMIHFVDPRAQEVLSRPIVDDYEEGKAMEGTTDNVSGFVSVVPAVVASVAQGQPSNEVQMEPSREVSVSPPSSPGVSEANGSLVQGLLGDDNKEEEQVPQSDGGMVVEGGLDAGREQMVDHLESVADMLEEAKEKEPASRSVSGLVLEAENVAPGGSISAPGFAPEPVQDLKPIEAGAVLRDKPQSKEGGYLESAPLVTEQSVSAVHEVPAISERSVAEVKPQKQIAQADSPISEPETLSGVESPRTETDESQQAQSTFSAESAEKDKEPMSVKIEKAEHRIDDLLSMSLIHSEAGVHKRLPEPVQRSDEHMETGIDLELNAANAPRQHDDSEDHLARHHEIKVIQPPAEMMPVSRVTSETQPVQQAIKPLSTEGAVKAAKKKSGDLRTIAEVERTTKDNPQSSASVSTTQQAQVAAQTVTAKALPQPVEVASARRRDEVVGVVETPVQGLSRPQAASEVSLPEPESLAADDVARLRAEREATGAGDSTEKSVDLESEPVVTRSSSAHEARIENEANARRKQRNKRSRIRDRQSNQGQQSERIESQEEAEHNRPTEAEEHAASLTGKLIMPTGERPVIDVERARVERPKKLAPGEVYVDENGNVVIGE